MSISIFYYFVETRTYRITVQCADEFLYHGKSSIYNYSNFDLIDDYSKFLRRVRWQMKFQISKLHSHCNKAWSQFRLKPYWSGLYLLSFTCVTSFARLVWRWFRWIVVEMEGNKTCRATACAWIDWKWVVCSAHAERACMQLVVIGTEEFYNKQPSKRPYWKNVWCVFVHCNITHDWKVISQHLCPYLYSREWLKEKWAVFVRSLFGFLD